MKILVRYLFINLLKPLLYLLLAFTLLFVVADLTNTLENFIEADASAGTVFKYYALLIPSVLIYIVPLCLLLATLYSLSMLTRHSEIVAMRASGVSIYRIVRPFLFMGLLCFLFTAVVNELWGPRNAGQAELLLEGQEEQAADTGLAIEYPALGHSWFIEEFDAGNQLMKGITLYQKRPDGSDEFKITAGKGQWLDQQWWFSNVTNQQYDARNNPVGPPEIQPVTRMDSLSEVPQDFIDSANRVKFFSSLKLRSYIAANKQLSSKRLTTYKVDFHHKLTMPFICIIATIIGIPVGAHTGRKGALSGIMLAIGMFFGFYLLQFTMLYLAKRQFITFYTGPSAELQPLIDPEIGNYIQLWKWSESLNVLSTIPISPWMGAWSAVILFTVIGGVMIHRMR